MRKGIKFKLDVTRGKIGNFNITLLHYIVTPYFAPIFALYTQTLFCTHKLFVLLRKETKGFFLLTLHSFCTIKSTRFFCKYLVRINRQNKNFRCFNNRNHAYLDSHLRFAFFIRFSARFSNFENAEERVLHYALFPYR